MTHSLIHLSISIGEARPDAVRSNFEVTARRCRVGRKVS